MARTSTLHPPLRPDASVAVRTRQARLVAGARAGRRRGAAGRRSRSRAPSCSPASSRARRRSSSRSGSLVISLQPPGAKDVFVEPLRHERQAGAQCARRRRRARDRRGRRRACRPRRLVVGRGDLRRLRDRRVGRRPGRDPLVEPGPRGRERHPRGWHPRRSLRWRVLVPRLRRWRRGPRPSRRRRPCPSSCPTGIAAGSSSPAPARSVGAVALGGRRSACSSMPSTRPAWSARRACRRRCQAVAAARRRPGARRARDHARSSSRTTDFYRIDTALARAPGRRRDLEARRSRAWSTGRSRSPTTSCSRCRCSSST